MQLSARSAKTEPGAEASPGEALRRFKAWFEHQTSAVFMTLRVKVFVLLCTVGLLVTLFSGVFVFHMYQGQADKRVDARMANFGDMMKRAARTASSPGDFDALVKSFRALAPIQVVAVIDPSGRIVSATDKRLLDRPISALEGQNITEQLDDARGKLIRVAGENLSGVIFARRVDMPFAQGRGIVYARVDLRPMLKTINADAWGLFVWLIAAIVVAVLMISLVIQRMLVTPIEALRDFAERGGVGALTVGNGPSDEIDVIAARLVEAFRATSNNEERLADLAETDGLTGLGNRAHFKARLTREIVQADESHQMIGVMTLNLDNFKVVNDSLGHNIGDLILQRTAGILKSCQRSGDVIARLGADEFSVILTGLASPEEFADIALRLIRSVGVPFRAAGHELHQTACGGLTIYPQDGRDADVLLKNADLALSRAKQEGAGACILYRHELHLRAMERNSIERDLRVALAQKQFVLYYQPKVDIFTGRIDGAEALVRWLHPERGLVAPDLFIPAAERCGIISDVTKWVLDEACRQNALWQAQGLPKIGMAVNVSAVDLRRPDLTDTVANTLVARGLSPQYLELEVTESMVMRDVDVVIGTLRRLRSLGVGIGIDDFGTGYSSLAYLKRFPVKRLKIDRSFISDIADERGGDVIPKVIIDLAHALGVDVLAEGVEDLAQLEILRALGCDEAQGYFLGRPMPAAEFEDFLVRATGGIHPDATIRAFTGTAPLPSEPVRDIALNKSSAIA